MEDRDLTVRGWMSPPEFTIGPEASTDEAFALMVREGIHHLLVLDTDDELVGIVTDRDLRRPGWKGDEIVNAREVYLIGDELSVGDVMTEDPVVVSSQEPTATAARIMVENRFNCLPVVDGDRVVGIVTSTDLLNALVHEVDPVALEVREAS